MKDIRKCPASVFVLIYDTFKRFRSFIYRTFGDMK